MTYMTYAELKTFAKEQMKPVTGTLVGAAAILIGFNLVIRGFSAFLNLSFIRSSVLRFMLRYLILILSNIFMYMLQAGFHNLSLKVCCRRQVSAADIFYAFANQTKNSFLLSAFLSLTAVVPMMPYNILNSWYAGSLKLMPITVRLFTYLPALILTVVLSLIYSQVFFLMLDFPSCTVTQLLKNSRLLMRGHKKRFFFIEARLLLILLIGSICTCCIGALWLNPFVYIVNTKFYLDLVTKRNLQSQIQPATFE